MAMELRALTVIDSLQPQLTGFLQTVCAGFMPLEEEAAAFIEIAPGIAINQLTDAALKATTVRPGMQIVERAYGMLEIHDRDKGQVEAAIDAIVGQMGVKREDRIKPKIISSQIITGLDGHQSQLINRMRHGDMIMRGQTLYILEVYPAAYAAIAANEAEKAADVHLMEVITFGAFGRLWLGGSEAEIKAASEAAEGALAKIAGRDGKS
jgi:ethanolamine utilization microcompartment shell protein EutS